METTTTGNKDGKKGDDDVDEEDNGKKRDDDIGDRSSRGMMSGTMGDDHDNNSGKGMMSGGMMLGSKGFNNDDNKAARDDVGWYGVRLQG